MREEFDSDTGNVETIQVMRSDPEQVQRDYGVRTEILGTEIKNNY